MVVKISDNLAAWLKLYANKKLSENKVKLMLPNFTHRFRAFLGENDIVWIQNALRHSSASYYLAKSKNEYETAQQMGHSVQILKTNCIGLVKNKDVSAYWRIVPEKLKIEK